MKRMPIFAWLLALALAITSVGLAPVPAAKAQTEQPTMVVIAGTIQALLGCPGDWQPDCDKTALAYDKDFDAWTATFELPAGEYEYKAALNGTWDEDYGANAQAKGANIKLKVEKDARVKFLFSRNTNWVTDNINSLVVTAPGSFQSELGCTADWQPNCLRSWMQDTDGDGKYTFTTKALPAGEYEGKTAVGETWGENYGVAGARDGGNLSFSVPKDGKETFMEWDSATKVMSISVEGAPRPRTFRAHWVTADTILWDAKDAAADTVYALHYSAEAKIVIEPDKVVGGEMLPLTAAMAETVDPAVYQKFPHLKGIKTALRLADTGPVADILRGQIVISASAPDGTLLDVTSPQIPGALDSLYGAALDKTLGISWDAGAPTFSLWAPTAQNVALLVYDDSKAESTATEIAMTRDDASGVWSVTGDAAFAGKYYLYQVTVYAPTTNLVEVNAVTDPYSTALAANSTRSLVFDLADPAFMPAGWADLTKPALAAPEDIVLYELHVRDFSIFDETVAEEQRGTFMAFADADSNGVKHLQRLAAAGITHVHLLPMFDFATVEEVRSAQKEVLLDLLKSFPGDSQRQQELVSNNANRDGFNWGYDPYHFNAPEGSYSTNPEGATRTLEFREAVAALSNMGLRVVMDVVYNHTNSAGQNPKSVFDKVVPGYYHRLNGEGKVETSTCCQNTASEHAMMEKFLIDSVVMWATAYKVDSFRFDLMGHHMKSNMLKLRAALDTLTLEADGVDGKGIYLYGEGWNFGEVANNARGEQATQLNLAGTGIGTFNDRLRDGARGGSPFGGQQEQGFINGLYDDVNEADKRTPEEREATMRRFMDLIRVGLAGNLKDYTFIDSMGKEVTGSMVDYNGQPAGYNADPQEHIIYVAAHDNETLFDAVQYKAPLTASMADRIRMQAMGFALTLYAQGVPFIHAGDEILRSKSMDRDSYNSGDWYNHVDYSYETNNWAIGMPGKEKNEPMWPVISELLANPALKPSKDDLLASLGMVEDMLRVRTSSRLFRLTSAEEVQKRVKFHDAGILPGVIVMSIDNSDGGVEDNFAMVVVVFNATKSEIAFTEPALAGKDLVLHPALLEGSDEVMKGAAFNGDTFTVPGRSAAVFVLNK
jgi:pullulanase